jgi:benzoate membrane transport protein
VAGVVTAVVGFSGAFTIVLAGFDGIGATTAQASSGLMILCLMQAVVAIWLGLRYRMPISIAWSTPGAALLATVGPIDGGYRAALGAFIVTGALIVIAGLSRTLGRWIAAIPVQLASAMLAGVLLPLCLAPARAATELPGLALPVIADWLLLTRFARRWAVPGALAATAVVVLIDGGGAAIGGDLGPVLTFEAPRFTTGAMVSVAIPLFLVTMASQNIPGMGVLASFGYRPPLRPILASTGAATMAAAPFGGHAVNLAAISAALAAGPDAGADLSRRWIASVTAGGLYIFIGLGAALATALITACPPLLVQAVAGLALMGALGGALSAALESEEHRDAAVVTLVVCASGITAAGISAAFWGLVAGLVVYGLGRSSLRPPRSRRAMSSPS